VPVGRRSVGVGGSDPEHDLGCVSRHSVKVRAEICGSIGGGVGGVLLRHGNRGYERNLRNANTAVDIEGVPLRTPETSITATAYVLSTIAACRIGCLDSDSYFSINLRRSSAPMPR
jgi:hypothetical protein